MSARERKSARGNKFAFALFSDTTGQFEAVIFSDTLHQCRDLLQPGNPVIVSVEAERDGDTIKLRVGGIEALDNAARSVEQGLALAIDEGVLAKEHKSEMMAELRGILKPGKGQIRLNVSVGSAGKMCELLLPGRYDNGPQTRGRLGTIPGVQRITEF